MCAKAVWDPCGMHECHGVCPCPRRGRNNRPASPPECGRVCPPDSLWTRTHREKSAPTHSHTHTTHIRRVRVHTSVKLGTACRSLLSGAPAKELFIAKTPAIACPYCDALVDRAQALPRFTRSRGGGATW